MKKRSIYLLILLIAFILFSCNKIKDYLREPDPSLLVETIHSCSLVSYSANVAYSLINGQILPHTSIIRSNSGFPCTTLMTIDKTGMGNYPVNDMAAGVTIAGLWADENTAVFSIMITKYMGQTSTLSVLGIKTIPAIRTENHISIALASMDIQMNPDEDALLSINLNTLEVQSELFRLEAPVPNDVYIAVLEDAYFMDIENNSTAGNLADDKYTITGGGQLVKVNGNDAEITQQAMVDVAITPECQRNPVNGMALMKVTGLEDENFPELGTAVFEFHSSCSGTAGIYAATGMYLSSNGRNVPFEL